MKEDVINRAVGGIYSMRGKIKKKTKIEHLAFLVGFLSYVFVLYVYPCFFEKYPAEIINSDIFKNGLMVNIFVFIIFTVLVNNLILVFVKDKISWFIRTSIGILAAGAFSFIVTVLLLTVTRR